MCVLVYNSLAVKRARASARTSPLHSNWIVNVCPCECGTQSSKALSLSLLPAILPFLPPSSNSTAVDAQKWNQLNVWSAKSRFLSRIRHHFPSRFFTPSSYTCVCVCVSLCICVCVRGKKRENQPLRLF